MRLALLSLALALPTAAAAARTVVTLTFDDGIATQMLALPLLDKYRLRGTFYINGGMVGDSSYYMTWSDVAKLSKSGHEIASHTLTHPHLTTLSAADMTREICGDRDLLISRGYGIVSFAYPFGEYNSAAESTAKSCGFTSARTTSGLMFSGGSGGAIPPRDPYALPAPGSVESGDSVATLENYVSRTVSGNGGWLPLVFHHICNGCNQYAITEANLSKFLEWLAAQRDAGRVVVATTAQVMAGATQQQPPAPPKNPPPAPAPPPKAPEPACPVCGHLRAFPNPWRADQHSGSVTIDGFSPQATAIEIYSAFGRHVRTLTINGKAAWDLRDQDGNAAGSGFYVYSVDDPKYGKLRGVLAVIR